MNFHELNDEQWWAVQACIAAKPVRRRGRPRVDDRRVLNGILYILYSGKPWESLPACYGSDTTCWRRYKEWLRDGTWSQIASILTTLPSNLDISYS